MKSQTISQSESRAKAIRILSGMGPIIVLLCLVTIMSFLSEYFFTVGNIINITRQAAVLCILAFGATIVIIGGGIDVSVGSVMALSSCVAAVLIDSFGVNVYVAMVASLVAGAGVGVLNGFIISKAGVPDFIVTLGMLSTAKGVALIITRGQPITNVPAQILLLGGGSILGIPVSLVVVAIVGVVAWFILNYTRLGRSIIACGGNKEAARMSGINVSKVKILTYIINGIFAAIAGLILTGRMNAANALMGGGYELNAIAAVIIGGTALFGGEGTVVGSLIGAMTMAVLSNGLNLLNVSAFWQQFAIGLIIIGVVVADRLRQRRLVSIP